MSFGDLVENARAYLGLESDPPSPEQVDKMQDFTHQGRTLDVKVRNDRRGNPQVVDVSYCMSPLGRMYGSHFLPANNAHMSQEFRSMIRRIEQDIYDGQRSPASEDEAFRIMSALKRDTYPYKERVAED